MILYFSGTGNSEYVAKRIGKEIGDETLNLFQKIRDRDFSELSSDRPWIFVVPTYAWRIPRIVSDWILKTDYVGNRNAYFVMTCGGSVANAGKYCEKLCRIKKLDYRGLTPIDMPENYVALFETPTAEEALEIIRNAGEAIDAAAHILKQGGTFPHRAPMMIDRILSGAVNYVFYPAFVRARKFYATDACVSCGKCAVVCPLGNVRLEHGKPKWGKDCTHCMACICRCPAKAIEYGEHSRGLPRYVCPNSESMETIGDKTPI